MYLPTFVSISKSSENLVKVSSERSAKSVKPVDIKGHRYSDKFDNSFIEILCVTNNTSVHKCQGPGTLLFCVRDRMKYCLHISYTTFKCFK